MQWKAPAVFTVLTVLTYKLEPSRLERWHLWSYSPLLHFVEYLIGICLVPDRLVVEQVYVFDCFKYKWNTETFLGMN